MLPISLKVLKFEVHDIVKMDLDTIIQKVNSGIYTLKPHEIKSQKTKSKCWDTFKDVNDDSGEILSSSTIEASVLVAQAIKKNLIDAD